MKTLWLIMTFLGSGLAPFAVTVTRPAAASSPLLGYWMTQVLFAGPLFVLFVAVLLWAGNREAARAEVATDAKT
jgi:hypothetical protein